MPQGIPGNTNVVYWSQLSSSARNLSFMEECTGLEQVHIIYVFYGRKAYYQIYQILGDSEYIFHL